MMDDENVKANNCPSEIKDKLLGLVNVLKPTDEQLFEKAFSNDYKRVLEMILCKGHLRDIEGIMFWRNVILVAVFVLNISAMLLGSIFYAAPTLEDNLLSEGSKFISVALVVLGPLVFVFLFSSVLDFFAQLFKRRLFEKCKSCSDCRECIIQKMRSSDEKSRLISEGFYRCVVDRINDCWDDYVCRGGLPVRLVSELAFEDYSTKKRFMCFEETDCESRDYFKFVLEFLTIVVSKVVGFSLVARFGRISYLCYKEKPTIKT